MLRFSVVLFSVCCVGLNASIGLAQDNPLSFFSKEVDVVVRVREPDQTFEKVAKFVERVQPGVGPIVQAQQEPVLGKLISNPTLTGADQTRDWYVGVYAVQNEAPQVVFAIPTTNSADFVAALGPGYQSRQEKNWVIYTDAAKLPAATASDSASQSLSQEIQTRLANGDIAVYVNSRHLSTVYADQIKLLQDKVRETISQFGSMRLETGMNVENLAKAYGSFLDAFFQSVNDSESLGIAVNLSDKDLLISHQADFTPGSPSAKFLAVNPQSSFPDLARLPNGWPVYTAMSGDVRGLIGWGTELSTSLYDVTPEKKSELEEALKFESVTFGPIVQALDLTANVSDALRQVTISDVAPASKYTEGVYGMQAVVGNVKTSLFEQTATVQRNVETYGAYQGDILTMKQEYTPEGDPSGLSTKILNLLVGSNGVETRIVTTKDRFISTVGAGQQLMKQSVTAVEEKKTNRIAKFREGLPAEANLLFLVDLPGLIGRGVKLAAKVEESPVMVNPDAVDNLGLTTSYIGVAIGSQGNTATSVLRIPVEQVIGVAKVSVLIGSSMKPGL